MFGTGLVSTSFDFGNQGALPTHPELLDFLAIKMQQGNWDMKKMLKYINNNLIEFIAIRDTIILVAMIYIAAQACKFVLLNIA